MAEKAPSNGTVLIVLGVIGLAVGVVYLLTVPLMGDADGAMLAGRLFGMLLFIGAGVALLIAGLNKRKAFSRSAPPSGQ